MKDKIKKAIYTIIYRINEFNSINILAGQTNRETFSMYKNYCALEKDVVICGAGPTLQKYEPIDGAIHIAVNRAFLYSKVDFDFIFAQDMDGIRMVKDELINYRIGECEKFLAKTYIMSQKTIPESYANMCKAKRFYTDNDIYRDGYNSKMILDIDKKPLGAMPNVGMAVIQLALFMNPRRLFIVGCDMTGTHFSDANQTMNEIREEKKQYDKYWENDHNKLIKKWEEIKIFANVYYPDTEIVSINPVGLRGLFRDLDQ